MRRRLNARSRLPSGNRARTPDLDWLAVGGVGHRVLGVLVQPRAPALPNRRSLTGRVRGCAIRSNQRTRRARRRLTPPSGEARPSHWAECFDNTHPSRSTGPFPISNANLFPHGPEGTGNRRPHGSLRRTFPELTMWSHPSHIRDATLPPSRSTICPVMKAAGSEHRNAAKAPSSSAVPVRRTGLAEVLKSRISSAVRFLL